MISSVKNKLILFTGFLHLWVFGHEMSDEMRKFLKNLSWSFFGGFIAAGIMFLVNVVAGRVLGPLEFGKYNYAISLATAFIFFFLLGNNQSGIRFISDKSYSDRKGAFLSALFVLTLLQSIVFLGIIFLFKGFILEYFNLSSSLLYYVLLLSLIFALKELLDSFIRSLELFKIQSIARILDAVFVLMTFASFYIIFKSEISYIYYVASIAGGGLFSIVYFFCFIKKHFRSFGKEEIKINFRYSKFLILGGLMGWIMSLEKVFIGKYIGMESLGNYSAYYASSQMIISNIGLLFMNIFWPSIVRNKDNIRPVIDKISNIFLKYFPIWAIINFISVYVFMSFYGKQYDMNIWLVLFFAVASIANVFFFVFMNFMNIDRIRHAVIINTIIYIILIGSIIIFRSISIYLAVQILIYLIGIMYVRGVLLRDTMKKI
jgi:O-antigen/teichoic acid export membrane protein